MKSTRNCSRTAWTSLGLKTMCPYLHFSNSDVLTCYFNIQEQGRVRWCSLLLSWPLCKHSSLQVYLWPILQYSLQPCGPRPPRKKPSRTCVCFRAQACPRFLWCHLAKSLFTCHHGHLRLINPSLQNTQVSETKEFREQYFHHSELKDGFQGTPISLWCYRGEVVTPRWMDVDTRRPLISQLWNVTYVIGNIENYTMLCTLEVDISRLPMSCRRKLSGEGVFYRIDYDIVLLFGLTELKAMLAWKENVSPFLVFWHPFCLQNAVTDRVLNDGVQHRLYTIPFLRTIASKCKGSLLRSWFTTLLRRTVSLCICS